MARTHGSMQSTEDVPYIEYYYMSGVDAAIAPSTTVSLTMGSFNMPWTGSIVASADVSAQWTGWQGCGLSLGASTPAPTNAGFVQVWLQPITTMIDPLSILGSWTSVAATTSVTIVLAVNALNGAATVTRRAVSCSIRVFPI